MQKKKKYRFSSIPLPSQASPIPQHQRNPLCRPPSSPSPSIQTPKSPLPPPQPHLHRRPRLLLLPPPLPPPQPSSPYIALAFFSTRNFSPCATKSIKKTKYRRFTSKKAQVDLAELRQKLQTMETLEKEVELLQRQKAASEQAALSAKQRQSSSGEWSAKQRQKISRLAGSPPDNSDQ